MAASKELAPLDDVLNGPSTARLIPASSHRFVAELKTNTAPPESPEERCASFGPTLLSNGARNKCAIIRIRINRSDHICSPALDFVASAPKPAAQMRVVADENGIATLSAPTKHNQTQIHLTSRRSGVKRRVSRKCPGDLPDLQIARWIGKYRRGGVGDIAKHKTFANVAANVLGGDEIVRRYHRSEKAPELSFVLPSAVGERSRRCARVRTRIGRSI